MRRCSTVMLVASGCCGWQRYEKYMKHKQALVNRFSVSFHMPGVTQGQVADGEGTEIKEGYEVLMGCRQ